MPEDKPEKRRHVRPEGHKLGRQEEFAERAEKLDIRLVKDPEGFARRLAKNPEEAQWLAAERPEQWNRIKDFLLGPRVLSDSILRSMKVVEAVVGGKIRRVMVNVAMPRRKPPKKSALESQAAESAIFRRELEALKVRVG
jgi:hypothetical protein